MFEEGHLELSKDDNDNRSTSERSSFTAGVLVGIGMSFGCLLLTSLLGHGGRFRIHGYEPRLMAKLVFV